MNHNTPTPWLTLRWPIPSSYPLNRMWRQSSNVNLLIMGSTGNPGLAVCKGLDVEKLSLLNEFMLSPRGERMTTALRGTGDRLTPDGHRVKLLDLSWLWPIHFPHDVNSLRMHVTLGYPWPRRLPPLA